MMLCQLRQLHRVIIKCEAPGVHWNVNFLATPSLPGDSCPPADPVPVPGFNEGSILKHTIKTRTGQLQHASLLPRLLTAP
jgi:hypothetical protein